MANQYVLVSLELTMEDQSKLRTAPRRVPLYDETDEEGKKTHDLCITWPGLALETNLRDARNHRLLKPWVDTQVSAVVFEKPLAELGVGPTLRVGLTSDPDTGADPDGTGTKTKAALTDESIGQIPASAV